MLKQIKLGCSLLLMALAISCGSNPAGNTPALSRSESNPGTISELLLQAGRTSGIRAAELMLLAAEIMLSESDSTGVSGILQDIAEPADLPATLRTRYVLVQAQLSLALDDGAAGLRWLTGTMAPAESEMGDLAPDYLNLLAQTQNMLGRNQDAVRTHLRSVNNYGVRPGIQDAIWETLQQISGVELDELAATATTYELRGWVELSRTVNTRQFNMKSQLEAVDRWRRTWSRHSAAAELPVALVDLQRIWERRPRHIALILPLRETAGIAIEEGFLSAYYEALEVTREVPRISVFDSSGAGEIYSIYDEAVAAGADLIIGPLNKSLVNQLRESRELPVTTLALNYADQETPVPRGLYQFGLAPEDEISQAISLAWNSGHRNAAVLTPATADYTRLQNIFVARWNELGGNVVSSNEFSSDSEYAGVVKRLMAIDSSESRAARLLDLLPRNNMEFVPRRRQDIDFIFLIANPLQGRQIKPTLAFYFAEDIPVYALPSINDGVENQGANRDLDGIVFPEAPWILNTSDSLKQQLTSRLRPAQGSLQRLRAMGIDSFRLYPRLEQFSMGQIQNLNGATGTLSMNENGRIQRRLEVARFSGGLAQRLPDAEAD